jgi:hypothetical protein
LDFAVIDEEGAEDEGQVHFFCNAGTAGIFNPCETAVLSSGGTIPIDVGAADFNGDGELDVMVLNQGDAAGEGTIALFIAAGNGNFSLPSQPTFSVPRVPQDLAIGLLNPNEDSIADAAIADNDVLGEDNVTLLYGGTGGAILTRRSAVLELATTALTIGGFGGNNNPDLAGTNDGQASDTSNIIAVNIGNGTNDQNSFSNSANVGAPLNGSGRVIMTGRFDDDAMDDLVVLSLDATTLRIALNRELSVTATPTTMSTATRVPTLTPSVPPTDTQVPTATPMSTATARSGRDDDSCSIVVGNGTSADRSALLFFGAAAITFLRRWAKGGRDRGMG